MIQLGKVCMVLLRLTILYAGLVSFEEYVGVQSIWDRFLVILLYTALIGVSFGRVTSIRYLDRK